MNRLLLRQLKKFNIDFESLTPEIKKFVMSVDETYTHFNEDRELLERSLEISSQELFSANSEMRSIFHYFPDIFFKLDKTGKVIDSNPDNSQNLVYSEESIIGTYIFDGPSLEVANHFKKAINFVNENQKRYIFEYELYLKGERKFFESSVIPIYDDKIVVFIKDISKRKQVEEALIESEELFRKLSASAQDSIIVINHRGEITYWNDASEKIFGYSASEAIGKNVHTFMAPKRFMDFSLSQFALFASTGEGAKVGTMRELTALKSDGTEFQIEISLSGLPMKGKWNAVGIIRDVTQRIAEQEELKSSKIAAEQANKAKSEFLTNVSHEIRTPLNAILGFTELLADFVTDQKYREYLIGISTGGKNLLQLINDILDLSKIEAGRLELEADLVDPYTICEEIGTIFTHRTAEKGIFFKIDYNNDLPSFLRIDDTRIRQVLLNLVGNAIKFTEKGSVTLQVSTREVLATIPTIDLIFKIIDTGIGIPLDQQELIFKEFYQSEGQSSRKYGGTGLGLAISRRLVEMMGGKIELESTLGKGSIFTVIIPNLEVDESVEKTDELQEQFDVHNFDFENALILLAEDIESNRKVVRGFLEGKNCRLVEALNGEEAIKMAELYKPDLILMDIQMPVRDGFSATEEIKSSLLLSDIPVIALTASVARDKVTLLLKLFDGYLRKPVSRVALIKEMAFHLNIKSLRNFKPEENYAGIPKVENDNKHENMGRKLSPETKEELLLEWNEVQSAMILDSISDFTDKVISAGKDEDIPLLSSYGISLADYVNSFKVEKITYTLAQFPLFIEKL